MADVLIETHEETLRLGVHEVARRLVSHLGGTAVSYLGGAKDSKQSYAWASAQGSNPHQDTTQRLIVAHRIWSMISNAESDYVARNWFIAANPRLGEVDPLTVLRDGNLKGALAAAVAFVDGTDG